MDSTAVTHYPMALLPRKRAFQLIRLHCIAGIPAPLTTIEGDIGEQKPFVLRNEAASQSVHDNLYAT